MIRYRLICSSDHEFEAWFRSGAEYDRQVERKIVACPQCGSNDVQKALMAPNVSTSRKKASGGEPHQHQHPQSVTNLRSEKAAKLTAMMREIREHVTKNAEYVGDNFADEARKIHYEETESRGIYGEASSEEAADLRDEGIAVAPLPVLPEDQN